jgi:hypothetical protein
VAKQHPKEHILQLTDAELRDPDVVKSQRNDPTRVVRPHFILSP